MVHVLFIVAAPDTAKESARRLVAAGHIPRIAKSIPAGLAWLEAFQFDLTLVQQELTSELDGLGVTRAIRALPRVARMPVVLLSAAPRVISLEAMFTAGVDGVLDRRVLDSDELLPRVEPFLRHGRSASGLWAVVDGEETRSPERSALKTR